MSSFFRGSFQTVSNKEKARLINPLPKMEKNAPVLTGKTGKKKRDEC
jgi:hypothetical protein